MLTSICLTIFVTGIVAATADIRDALATVPEDTPNKIDAVPLGIGQEQGEESVVTTEYGAVRGFQKDSGIWQYFDIPYGEFTIENPFKEPSPPRPWSDTREESEHKSRCPQMDLDTDLYTGTSDCLTLSVFTPAEPKNSDVLFHIHDGFFSSGSGDDKVYGPEYLVSSGIILVLPNYRLGPLGFLCLESDDIPGNAGLKDLVLALEWTKNNIEAFGGNSSNIVVSGSGSGAALVEYLATSQKSQHIVTKAITESGSMLSNWAIDRRPAESAAKLEANLKNIGSASTVGILTKKLNEASLEELVRASKDIIFKPCIERGTNGFLTNTPMSVLLSADLSIDVMIGAANMAGMHNALLHDEESLLQINRDSVLLLPDDLEVDEDLQHDVAQRVTRQYFGAQDVTMQTIRELAMCYTDHSYLSPAVRAARLLLDAGSSVYFYEFSFGIEEEHEAVLGESMKYVFNRGNIFVENTMEYTMEILMRNLWVNFIKTGVPKSEGVEWEKFKETKVEDEIWLSIGSTVEAQGGLHVERLRLWDDLYKKYFVDRSKTASNTFSLLPIFLCLIMIVTNQNNFTD